MVTDRPASLCGFPGRPIRLHQTSFAGTTIKRILAVLAFTLSLAACGDDSVEENTYEAAGRGLTIAFKSGGKATFSIGPQSQECTYAQSGKKVGLTCEGDKTDFTIADDGALHGPPQGMLGRLTKKKT